jgi:5-hydroxyisourate hydrolase-like protein (transthyretin family)
MSPRSRILGAGALLLGVCLFSWRSLNAGGPGYESNIQAAFKNAELLVAVDLTSTEPKKVAGPVTVELLENGKELAKATLTSEPKDAKVSHTFQFKANPQAKDRLKLKVTFAGHTKEMPLGDVLLVKGQETTLLAGQDFFAGSQGAMQVNVQAIKSIAETKGVAGANVFVTLRDEKANKTYDLTKATTDAKGSATLQLDIPDLAPGQYVMEVTTRSRLGEEKLVHAVRIKADAKVLLVSDKPIYQPGQMIHMRALVLQSFNMKPIAQRDIVFEVEDNKGNKVFKKSFKTSDFGVASIDFQLADEVNMGDYHLRANVGDTRAEKTVQVKRYVLPKFKTNLTTDKTFYLPKETIKAELQSDYFFGKPVAKGKIEVVASTFDVAFKQFHKWTGVTDENGHAKFEVTLPDYFVGQPLQKGNAIVKLDVTLVDSADHHQEMAKSLTVSDQPIKVSLIAEGGKIAAGLENRVFVAAIYPDGSPAPNCAVQLWVGKEAKGEPIASLKTNASGLAEFRIKPEAKDFRQTGMNQINVEFLGGMQQHFGPQLALDIRAQAQDPRGEKAAVGIELNAHPFGENILVRLDKAIYQVGDRLGIDVRTSAGMPTAFVDIVRGGQILLSKWVDVKDGKAQVDLDVPPTVFGSLEVHAYQMLQHGEIIRDSRVVYVQPRSDLKIDVKNTKAEFAPGEEGRLRFVVTDSAGNPTAAALGVIVVDEAVYALQELQPGLEKVYFTLQEELLKPQVQLNFSPGRIDNLILQPQLGAPQQQIAEALLTAIKLPAPARWNVDPGVGRRQHAEAVVSNIARHVFGYAFSHPFAVQGKDGLEFKEGLFEEMQKSGHMHPGMMQGPFGETLTIGDMRKLEPAFTAEKLAQAITLQRSQQFSQMVNALAQREPKKHQKNGEWIVDETLLSDAMKQTGIPGVDGWGRAFKLVVVSPEKGPKVYDVVSAGADGRIGTKDDIGREATQVATRLGWMGHFWWLDEARQAGAMAQGMQRNRGMQLGEMQDGAMMMKRQFGGFGGGGPGAPQPVMAPRLAAAGVEQNAVQLERAAGNRPNDARDELRREAGEAKGSGAPAESGPAPISRVREYFPETMMWMPNLITDDNGVADLSVSFADSITTWRLSASANSASGLLGNTNIPLKVFQDFFVDIDLPVALTQTDEVAFPVAVYNYLKVPQTVKLQLQQEPWFTLLGDKGLERSLDLKPGEVTAVKYRIKANKIGQQPLLVKAFGSKKSDAVKRMIDVVPNGEKIEKTFSDRLSAKASQIINIPEGAAPDASKLFVRIYPGAMAQVMEGVDSILRLPGGCFEQTSSSAYPNILVVDYIKKAKIASPQLLMKAENYLNVGYQKLLTFERPGGGFDWWGSGEPLVWLSAYGLQEFSDMAKVYPIDRGIIDRTQAFLMKKRDADGTWSNIGATHGETIERMGNTKLLLTSYVTWSLLESGFDKKQLMPSVNYIRTHLADAGDNAYILALAANALATFDPKDDSTLDCVNRLEKLRHEIAEWKAIDYPAAKGGVSLTYARGDAVTVETTALAAMAMLKTGQHINSVNQALTYLVKVKGNGHWGSTQATILALRALAAGMGGPQVKDALPFTINVNGKDVIHGKVDADNSDVMQAFDLAQYLKAGDNKVDISIKGESGLMYQVLARHYMPWNKENVVEKKKVVDIDVTYDRTKLAANDLLHAKATLKYSGDVPTFNVIVDLGIAPGFTVDAGEFAEMVAAKKVAKFTVTSRQVTLYLGDVKPGDVLNFEYSLRAKYPLRVQAPGATAWEYYTPANRAESRPVELTVEERK